LRNSPAQAETGPEDFGVREAKDAAKVEDLI